MDQRFKLVKKQIGNGRPRTSMGTKKSQHTQLNKKFTTTSSMDDPADHIQPVVYLSKGDETPLIQDGIDEAMLRDLPRNHSKRDLSGSPTLSESRQRQ